MLFKNILLAAIIIGSSLTVKYTYAAQCSSSYPNVSITVPNTVLQEHASYPVGAPLGGIIGYAPNVFQNCKSDNPENVTGRMDMRMSLAPSGMVIEGRQIYATGLKGLGFAIAGSFWPSGTPACSTPKWFTPGITTIVLCDFGDAYTGSYHGDMKIQFYKTEENLAPGVFSSLRLGDFRMYYGGAEYRYRPTITLKGSAVTTGTCDLNSTSVKVAMSKVFKSQFQGVGLPTKETTQKDFKIPLDCTAGTKVNIQIEGDTINAAQGLLKLSEHKLSASGVGIQLLYNNSPIKLSEFFNVGTAEITGTFNIPLSARYLQTENEIKPGIANGSATFILKYY
jgi:type 1 fimbria pilin